MFSSKSPVPQWIADLRAGKMLDANPAALAFWRMTREQFLSARFDEMIHPEEMPRWEKYIAAGDWGEAGTWKCIRGDGSIFYCVPRWQMTDYRGKQCAIVFPIRAGDSPDHMFELKFIKPKK